MFGVGSYLNKQMKLTFRSKSEEEEESLKKKKASKRQKRKWESPIWQCWLSDVSHTKWASSAQSPFMTSDWQLLISRVTCDLLSNSHCPLTAERWCREADVSNEHPSSAINHLWDTQKPQLRISVSHKSQRPRQRAEGSTKGVVLELTANRQNLSFYLVIIWKSITNKLLWTHACTT